MATQLGLYNAALIEIGDKPLASLTEAGEPRRILDQVYSDVVADCLEEASWNFAIKTIQSVSDTGIEPSFGLTEVFAKPSDWVRTHAVSADDRFSAPLLDYVDDVNYWSSDTSPIYVRYVSNDASFGLDLTKWPRTFTRYVELALAHRILPRLSQSRSDKERIDRDMRRAKRNAMNKDVMNEAQPKFAPSGSWTTARGGGPSGDRGSRGSLTG